ALARARVGLGALPAHREAAPVPEPAVAADLHQPLDVQRDLLPEIALHPADLLDHLADRAHILFRQVLDPNVGRHPGLREDVVRALAPDTEDVGEPDLDALGAREVYACNPCHMCVLTSTVPRTPRRGVRAIIPAAACASGSRRSPAPPRGGGRSCTSHRCASPML